MFKKFIAAVLAAVVLASALAGCAEKQGTAQIGGDAAKASESGLYFTEQGSGSLRNG